MNIQEKLIIIILLIIPLCFVAMRCSSQTQSPQKSGTSTESSSKELTNATGENSPDSPSDPARLSRIPKVLRIAYVPSIEAGTVVERTDDIDKAISEKLGIPVESSIIQNYVMAVEGLGSGHFDCAMLSPLGYVLGKQRYPIEPLLMVKRNGATEYKGQIIVNVDSGIESIEDIKGRTFAFVDQVSTSGHIYPRVLLLKHGIDIMKDIKNGPVYVGSHDKVALDVMHGTVDAGATFSDVRERVKAKYPDVMTKTKIIELTDTIPNESFCVTSDLDLDFRERLKSALKEISLGVTTGMEVRRPLYDLDKIEELVSVSDADYDIVREIINQLDFDLVSKVKEATEKQ